MLFEKFTEVTAAWWSAYLRKVSKAHIEGKLNLDGKKLLYPNILLVTNCHGYYIAELLGATKKFTTLSIKKHSENSIYRYFSQFDETCLNPIITFDASRNGLRNISLARDPDVNEIRLRFPQIDLFGTFMQSANPGQGSTIAFGEHFVSCVIENSILANRHENIFRCKNILSAFVVKSSIGKNELTALYSFTTNDNTIRGIHTTVDSELKILIGGQFQSMYLFPRLHETTIGEFIRLHPDIVRTAFKTDHFEYEPYLDWVEHDGTCKDSAINPDLLIKRPDGYYDIYDLKTARLDRKSITKADRSRRRFIDYVEEGIAQLANYREYFDFPKNAIFAKNKYGIEVNNPQLVLVVGSWENVDFEEVNQACRRYQNVRIIDYDTVCHMFIGT